MEFAPNAERVTGGVKGGENCVVGVCSKAFGVVFCNGLDMPQRCACQRMPAECGGSPSSLSSSAKIWLMTERAAAL